MSDTLTRHDNVISRFSEAYGPAPRALSRLIRPALIAPPGKALVWGDWKNVEARVTPWLALSADGQTMLKKFIRADADPAAPDVYTQQAADMLGIPPSQVSKDQRNAYGKVTTLALGFGGGRGALLNMATVYGVHIGDSQAEQMVKRWRDVNPWARDFWNDVWQAILTAVDQPGTLNRAGRISYLYRKSYLGGSLMCALPDGRLLTYPQCRWDKVKHTDDLTGEVSTRRELRYRKGHARATLWHGKAVENAVQGTAGSLLRDALTAMEEEYRHGWCVVGHTHDDIIIEVPENEVEDAKDNLLAQMVNGPAWSGGLPLAADISTGWYFSKAGD